MKCRNGNAEKKISDQRPVTLYLFILLCSGEGKPQVVLAVRRLQRVVVELQREEGVHQSAERHAVAPAGWEVLDVYVLAGRKLRSQFSPWQHLWNVTVRSQRAQRERQQHVHQISVQCESLQAPRRQTWYPIVLERHHSKRICFIPLALDTPKLWERFSLGLESLGLFQRDATHHLTEWSFEYLGLK